MKSEESANYCDGVDGWNWYWDQGQDQGQDHDQECHHGKLFQVVIVRVGVVAVAVVQEAPSPLE